MDIPVRSAWCNLKFTSNGGRVDAKNYPILSSYDVHPSNPDDPNDPMEGTWVRGARGYCDRATDCDRCFLMIKYLDKEIQDGRFVSWECTTCAYTPISGWATGVPGYYTSHLPEGLDEILGKVYPDPICPRCQSEVSYLQLVLRVPA